MSKIIFVVGSPRSGTTYLSRALGLAENAAYLGESNLFCLSAPRIDTTTYAKEMKPRDLFPYNQFAMQMLGLTDRLRKKDRVWDAAEHLILMSKVEEYDLKPSDVLYRVQNIELSPREIEELTELTARLKSCLQKKGLQAYAQMYFEEFARRKGCQIVVEKTPLHLRTLPILHAAFPESKVVLICRDKKECLRSYLKTFGKGPGRNRFLPAGLARKKVWSELLADIRREEWAARQPGVTRVEFNDFVTRPTEVAASLADRLELRFDWHKRRNDFPEYIQGDTAES